jgi:membrane-bound metal-dependent hydrolase YbcI (DUF457 family)
MANFQTHLTVAAAGSMTATAVCVQTGIVSHPEALLLLSLGTLAGILPDIDSDHSVPTRLVFNIISFAVATAALFALQGKVHLILMLGISLLGALFVRYIVYALFAGITEHRGLFHSLPAALLFGLMTVSVGIHMLDWSLHFAWLAAAFVSCGYLLHLMLDEMYSVNFMNSTLKQSFGSALTLFNRSSWVSYLLLYAVVGASFYLLPTPKGWISL